MTKDDHTIRPRRPATTPEGREQQLTALAMDAIEKRIINGTASAQELTYFAKLGSPTARLERKILEQQAELLEAKTTSLKSQAHMEDMYEKAMSARRDYAGYREREDEYPR